MTRLPIPGQDSGTWGTILNDFLGVEHNPDGSLKTTGTLSTKANDSAVVHNTGNETITGTKTFTASPIVPAPTLGGQVASKNYVDTATQVNMLSVKAYGAVGDGATDDTSAINATFAAAIATGVKMVYLPAGTYKLAPTGADKRCLRMPAGLLAVRGAGPGKTTLKVANGVGDYYSIIDNDSTNNDVSGVEIADLTIDMNNTNNQATGGSFPVTTWPRACIRVTKSTTCVYVRRVHIIDADTVWFVASDGTSRGLLVEDCRFVYGNAPYEHDFSGVYHHSTGSGLDTRECWVQRCTFDSPGAGSKGAHTAIETHAGAVKITDNVIRGYSKGFNISGFSNYVTKSSTLIQGNTVVDAKWGMEIWSSTYGLNSGPIGLQNVVIADNTFCMNGPAWATVFGGSGYAQGIFLDPSSNLAVENVRIAGNTFRFDNGSYTALAGDSLSFAIDWRRTTPGSIIDTDVVIADNRFDSPLSGGIRIATSGNRWVIRNNRLSNIGRGTAAAGGGISNGFGCGIMITQPFTNSIIQDNRIDDEMGVSAGTSYGIYIAPASSGTANNRIMDNTISGATGKRIEIAVANAGGWLMQAHGSSSETPSGAVDIGSTIESITDGSITRQTTSPNGTTWLTYRPQGGLPAMTTLAGKWIVISGYPLVSASLSAFSRAKDTWWFMPICLPKATSFSALGLYTTVAATGGSAAGRFALFNCDANNLPGTLAADWSATHGTLDLTAAAGGLSLTTTGLSIPSGDYYIGFAWSGTATGAPTIYAQGGAHMAVGTGSGPHLNDTAYSEATSGASAPNPATPAAVAGVGVAIWAKVA